MSPKIYIYILSRPTLRSCGKLIVNLSASVAISFAMSAKLAGASFLTSPTCPHPSKTDHRFSLSSKQVPSPYTTLLAQSILTFFFLSVRTSNFTPQQSPIMHGPFTTNSRSPFLLNTFSFGVQQPPQQDWVTRPITWSSSFGPWYTVTFSRHGSNHAHGKHRKCRWNASTCHR